MRLVLSVCALALAGVASARGDSLADFYRGKTVNLVVSSAPGGAYDLLSRLVARYIVKHLPGAPQVVVRNMPGAGGVVATNYLFNVAPRDGLTFGNLQNTLPFEPLFQNAEAKYDATQFKWLGSQSYESGLYIVWKDVPVSSIADIQKRETSVGAPGRNSTPSFDTHLLAAALGLKLRLVQGYTGQNDIFLAMERGEVDSFPTFYSSLMSTRPNWVAEKKVKLIVQFGPEPEPAIAQVPFAADIVADPSKKQLLKAGAAPLSLGRPFAAPPDTPAEQVAALRQALADTFADPDYLAEATKLHLPVNQPRTGEQLQAIIEDVYRMPESAKDQLRRLATE